MSISKSIISASKYRIPSGWERTIDTIKSQGPSVPTSVLDKILRAPLVRDSGLMFIIRSSSYLLAFAVNVIYARLLGVDEFTTYLYAISWLPILQIVALVGTDNTVLKFLPRYQVSEDWGKIKYLLRNGILVTFVASVIVSVVFYFLTNRYPVSDDLDMAKALTLIAWVLPTLVIFSLQYSVLRVFDDVMRGTVLQELARPIMQLLLIMALSLVVSQVRASDALIAYGVTMLIGGLIANRFIAEKTPAAVKHVEASQEWKVWMAVSIPLFAISGFQLITRSMDILMLGYMTDTRTAGIYGISSRIAALGSFGFAAINLIVVPSFSKFHSAGDQEGLQKRVQDAAKLIFLSGAAFGIGIYLMSDFLLGIFGEEYRPGRTDLLILLSGHVFISFAGTAGFVMAMTGHHNRVFVITFLAVLQNIAFNYLLIKNIGSHGAAIATIYTQIFSTSAMVYYLLRHVGLNTSILPLHKLIPQK